MDTALPQKFPFILDRNLAKANCTENQVCTSCDTVVLGGGSRDESRVACRSTGRPFFRVQGEVETDPSSLQQTVAHAAPLQLT